MVWLGFFSIRKAPCVYKLLFTKLLVLKKKCSVISCIIKKKFFCEQQNLVSCGLVPHGGIMLHLMRSTLAEAFSPVHKDTLSCDSLVSAIHLGSNCHCLGSLLSVNAILPTWPAVPPWRHERVMMLYPDASPLRNGWKLKHFRIPSHSSIWLKLANRLTDNWE